MKKHNVELTNNDSNALACCSRTSDGRTNCYPEPTVNGLQAMLHPNSQDGFEVIPEEYMDSVTGEYGTDCGKNTELGLDASVLHKLQATHQDYLLIITVSQGLHNWFSKYVIEPLNSPNNPVHFPSRLPGDHIVRIVKTWMATGELEPLL